MNQNTDQAILCNPADLTASGTQASFHPDAVTAFSGLALWLGRDITPMPDNARRG
ncbi:MAG: hypothetical protein ABW127_11955 [Candidatus Thiodiazotropha endolucinida]